MFHTGNREVQLVRIAVFQSIAMHLCSNSSELSLGGWIGKVEFLSLQCIVMTRELVSSVRL